MPLTTYDGFLSRIGAGYWLSQPLWDELQTSIVGSGSNNFTIARTGRSKALPGSLPTGVTNYIVTRVSLTTSTSNNAVLVGKLVSLGSLDLGTNVFTDGAQMPTVTECGVSRQASSGVLGQVTTALNATPGNITITYVDQDGNAAETTANASMGASAPVNSVFWVRLNSTDWGVRDITAAAQNGGTTPSGVVQLYGIVPLSLMPAALTVGVPTADNLLTSAFNPVRLGAGDAVGAFTFGGTNTRALVGEFYVVGDN